MAKGIENMQNYSKSSFAPKEGNMLCLVEGIGNRFYEPLPKNKKFNSERYCL